MTEEFEDMIEEVEDEVVEDSQSSADPINTELLKRTSLS